MILDFSFLFFLSSLRPTHFNPSTIEAFRETIETSPAAQQNTKALRTKKLKQSLQWVKRRPTNVLFLMNFKISAILLSKSAKGLKTKSLANTLFPRWRTSEQEVLAPNPAKAAKVSRNRRIFRFVTAL